MLVDINIFMRLFMKNSHTKFINEMRGRGGGGGENDHK